MKNKATNTLVHVFVSLPTQDVCSLRDIDTNMLVHQLKSRIELKVGIPGDLIHLFFMNEELAADKALSEYKLKHGCIIRVRLHKTWLGLFLSCWKGDIYEVFNNGVQKMDVAIIKDLDVDLWNKLVVKRATFALFLATHRGYLSLMLELLNSSAADINGCSIFGRSSLHVAAYQGFVGCVSMLLSEGALSDTVDIFGKTALQLAAINKHIYCQKRIYLHQSSGGDEFNRQRGHRESKEGEHRVQSSPQKLFRHGQLPDSVVRKASNVENSGNGGTEGATTAAKALPKIVVSVDEKASSTLHHDSKSSSLPSVRTKELDSENDHSGGASDDSSDAVNASHHADILVLEDRDLKRQSNQLPFVNAYAEDSFPHEVDSEQKRRDLPKSILGIENILRTSQDDIVGEYHNIEESLASVNVKTILLTLPNDGSNQQAEPDEVSKQGNGDENNPDTCLRAKTPSDMKRVLGFVLKSGESSHETELECAQPAIEPPQSSLGEQMWDRSISTDLCHRRLASALSYNEWLKKKLDTSERPKTAATERSGKSGRDIDHGAFQKWLSDKKKVRGRRASSPSISEKRPGAGASFEIWLSQKRQQKGFSFEESTLENPSPKPKTVNFSGKTFSEWVSDKQKLEGNNDDLMASENRMTRSHSGKSYKEWRRDKRKEKQKENEQREILEIEKLAKKEFLEIQRRQNPRVKTFQEWLEEKRANKLIDSVQFRNTPRESSLLTSDTKFQEDSDLVFDMWLASKYMDELRKEEEMYEEMKEKWRKKEQERLQVRNGLLTKLSQMKGKDHDDKGFDIKAMKTDNRNS